MSARTIWWVPRVLGWWDWWFCWQLACDPLVRTMSLDRRKPGLLRHLRWMARWVHGALGGERIAWVIEVPEFTGDDHGVPWHRAGLVRVNTVADRTLEFSIALAAPYRGVGLGTDVIKVMTATAACYWHREVIAKVRPENTASTEAFRHAGYRPIGLGRDRVTVLEWRES